MKLIHTADIHLDSPLIGVADSKTRRMELLRSLDNLSQFANNNGVSAIIVAGDLFDEKFVAAKTVEAVAHIISQSNAQWFVLQGNHGDSKPYERLKQLCPKVFLFSEEWQTYTMGNVAITARELGKNDASQWQNLQLNPKTYNILALHGDVDDPSYGLIDKNAIAALPINYVALGHRHTFKQMRFGNVRGCYSGVPEPRGFDENCETGFVLIDTDLDKISFVPQHIRRVENKKLDVSTIADDWTLRQRILDCVADVSPQNYLNLEFVGQLSEGVRLGEIAQETLLGRFFALRVRDATKLKLNLQELQKEVSLRGEFVKLAMQLDENERDEVLRLGLAALEGEL